METTRRLFEFKGKIKIERKNCVDIHGSRTVRCTYIWKILVDTKPTKSLYSQVVTLK
jgi:hypothetical protein